MEHILGVFVELVLADTCSEVWGEVVVNNLDNGEGKWGLGVKELELLQSEWQAKAVHGSQPKWVSVDCIPLSEGARDLGSLVVKIVLDVGHNDLVFSDDTGDEDPVVM